MLPPIERNPVIDTSPDAALACESGFAINMAFLTGTPLNVSMIKQNFDARKRYWTTQGNTSLRSRASEWIRNASLALKIEEQFGDNLDIQKETFWLHQNISLLQQINPSLHKEEIEQFQSLLSHARDIYIPPTRRDTAHLIHYEKTGEEYKRRTHSKVEKWHFQAGINGQNVPAEVTFSDIGMDNLSTQREVICVPISVGCPAGCRMCQIGETNVGQLTSGQMLKMALTPLYTHSFPRMYPERTKISWLGGGDPAFNMKNFRETVQSMQSYFPESTQVASTVGVNESSLMSLCDLATEVPQLNLQVSLLTLEDEARKRLVPLRKMVGVGNALQIMEKHWENTGKVSHVSLILFEGINDDPKQTLDPLLRSEVNPQSILVVLDVPHTVSDRSLKPVPLDGVKEVERQLNERGFSTHIYATPPIENEPMQPGCGTVSEQTLNALNRFRIPPSGTIHL